MHDKRLLAADRMPGQGSIRKPDPVRLLDDGDYLDRLNDVDEEHTGRHDHAVAARHRFC